MDSEINFRTFSLDRKSKFMTIFDIKIWPWNHVGQLAEPKYKQANSQYYNFLIWNIQANMLVDFVQKSGSAPLWCDISCHSKHCCPKNARSVKDLILGSSVQLVIVTSICIGKNIFKKEIEFQFLFYQIPNCFGCCSKKRVESTLFNINPV